MRETDSVEFTAVVLPCLGFGPSVPPSPAVSAFADPAPPATSRLTHICRSPRRGQAPFAADRASVDLDRVDRRPPAQRHRHRSSKRSAASSPASGWIRARACWPASRSSPPTSRSIAHHGPALPTLAARQGRQLRFEAAVGGAMPIVRAVGEGLAGDRITRIVGDPERHHQRRPVADGGDRLLDRQTRCADARATRLSRKPIRRPISTATMRARSWRSCARSRSGCAWMPRRSRARSSAAIDAPPISRERGARRTIRQIAHAEYDRGAVDAHRLGRAGRRRARLDLWPHDGRAECRAHHRRARRRVGCSAPGAGGDATAVAILGDLLAIARDRGGDRPALRSVRRQPAVFRDFTIHDFVAEAV